MPLRTTVPERVADDSAYFGGIISIEVPPSDGIVKWSFVLKAAGKEVGGTTLVSPGARATVDFAADCRRW